MEVIFIFWSVLKILQSYLNIHFLYWWSGRDIHVAHSSRTRTKECVVVVSERHDGNVFWQARTGLCVLPQQRQSELFPQWVRNARSYFSLSKIRKEASNRTNIPTFVSTESVKSQKLEQYFFFINDHGPEERLPRRFQQLYIFVKSYLLVPFF